MESNRTLITQRTRSELTLRTERKLKGSWICKPNSVCRITPAGRPFLWAEHCCAALATYPEVVAHRAGTRILPYLVLLRVGFALPAALLKRRCALTAPFHPYLAIVSRSRFVVSFETICRLFYPDLLNDQRRTANDPQLRGGIFSVALSVDWPLRQPPGRYPAHCSSEFGLSSPVARATKAAVRSSCLLLHYI